MRNRAGTPVKAVIQIRNPKAVEIVNSRVVRDHLSAAVAASLIIIESADKKQGKIASAGSSQG